MTKQKVTHLNVITDSIRQQLMTYYIYMYAPIYLGVHVFGCAFQIYYVLQVSVFVSVRVCKCAFARDVFKHLDTEVSTSLRVNIPGRKNASLLLNVLLCGFRCICICAYVDVCVYMYMLYECWHIFLDVLCLWKYVLYMCL